MARNMPVVFGSLGVKLYPHCSRVPVLPCKTAARQAHDVHSRGLRWNRSSKSHRRGWPVAAKDNDADPFFTERNKGAVGRSSQQEDDAFWQQDSRSLQESSGNIFPQATAKPKSPLVTRVLVLTMIALFVYQWWPFLTNFQHQSSFITNASRGRTGPSSFLPALKHLTFGIPEPGHWPNLLVSWMLDYNKVVAGQWWRFYTTTLLHANLLHLMANVVAIHEFGKELEGRINKLQYLAVLLSAAFGSGVFMIATGRPVGTEALLPVSASGLVTGITAVLFLLALFMKDLRQQGTLGSSGTAIMVAFLLGQLVPALDNGVHFGGLVGGLIAGAIVLLWLGLKNVFRGRKTSAASPARG